jgi:hypothetical protein
MKYNDPSGHSPWDTISTVVDFAQGIGAQVGYNNTSMAIPSAINVYAPQSGESAAMGAGRHFGNVVSGVQAVVEVVGGASGVSGGAAACATGVGCLAGAPAIAAGAAAVAHGSAVGINAALQEGQMLANLMMAVMSGGSSKLTTNIPSSGRKYNQLESRGWSKESIDEVVNNPFTTRESVNKATGNSATAYYRQDGHYVVRDDITGDLVQMSKTDIPAKDWLPDPAIKNPYIPSE